MYSRTFESFPDKNFTESWDDKPIVNEFWTNFDKQKNDCQSQTVPATFSEQQSLPDAVKENYQTQNISDYRNF